MAASIAWLDASPDEQRKVREIVKMFSQRETQDEMGGRRIVVALSDALFPGTSVLHSRARYLLFIPWFAQRAAFAKHPARRMEVLERSMIASFLDNDVVEAKDRIAGLIGSTAGPQVKQLPSTAYWTALEAWGILEWPGTLTATLERIRHLATWTAGDDLDEFAERSLRVWHPGVGELPSGFPVDDLDGGFQLRRGEASWLRERWIDRAGGSMLTHLSTVGTRLTADYPWDEPACRAPSNDPGCAVTHADNIELIAQAQRFALAIQGPQLLYALMIAKRYAESGYNKVDVNLEMYRNAIAEWEQDVADADRLFAGWNQTSFWDELTSRGVVIDPLSKAFFGVSFDVVRSGPEGTADDASLMAEVANREALTKRRAGRLQNDALLASWLGGWAGRTTFRWPQVKSLVNDVTEGLGRTDAAA